jgi:hypothetical protein
MVLDTGSLGDAKYTQVRLQRKCQFTSAIPETCVSGGFGNFMICMPALQPSSINELRLCLGRRRRQSATFGVKSTRGHGGDRYNRSVLGRARSAIRGGAS